MNPSYCSYKQTELSCVIGSPSERDRCDSVVGIASHVGQVCQCNCKQMHGASMSIWVECITA